MHRDARSIPAECPSGRLQFKNHFFRRTCEVLSQKHFGWSGRCTTTLRGDKVRPGQRENTRLKAGSCLALCVDVGYRRAGSISSGCEASLRARLLGEDGGVSYPCLELKMAGKSATRQNELPKILWQLSWHAGCGLRLARRQLSQPRSFRGGRGPVLVASWDQVKLARFERFLPADLGISSQPSVLARSASGFWTPDHAPS